MIQTVPLSNARVLIAGSGSLVDEIIRNLNVRLAVGTAL